MEHRSRDSELLLHPATPTSDALAPAIPQSGARQELLDARPTRRSTQSPRAGVELQVVGRAEPLIQSRMFEEGSAATAHGVTLSRDVVPQDRGPAGVRRKESQEQTDHRRFSRTVRAQQTKHNPGGYGKGHLLERPHGPERARQALPINGKTSAGHAQVRSKENRRGRQADRPRRPTAEAQVAAQTAAAASTR